MTKKKTVAKYKPLTPEQQHTADIQRVGEYLKDYVPSNDAEPGMSARVPGYINKKALKGKSPDEEDKKNIDEYIKTYNIAFPYPHPQSLQAAHEEGLKGTIRDPSKVRKGGEKTPTLALRLPLPFVTGLKKAYPLIFIDDVQFAWFMKNFSELSLIV